MRLSQNAITCLLLLFTFKKSNMSKKSTTELMPDEVVMTKILLIRGKKVMIDRDLAELYGVTTFRLNE